MEQNLPLLMGFFVGVCLYITARFREKWDHSSAIIENRLIGILVTFLGLAPLIYGFDQNAAENPTQSNPLLTLTNILLIVFLVINIWINFVFWKKWDKPTLINVNAVIGILGTFIGITIALLSFNLEASDPKIQIAKMLAGIKFAFITSIGGLVLGLIVRFAKKADETIDNEEELQNKVLTDFEKLLRKQDDMINSFENVTTKLADNNAAALEKVVTNFNEKVQTQFGENFKLFSAALKEFAPTVTELSKNTRELSKKVEAILGTQNKFSEFIDKSVQKSKQVISRFEDVLDKHERTIQQLTSQTEQTQNRFVEILNRQENLIQKFDTNTEQILVRLNETIQNQDAINQHILGNVDQTLYRLNEILHQQQQINHQLGVSLQEIFGKLDRILNKMDDVSQAVMQDIHQSLQNITSLNNNILSLGAVFESTQNTMIALSNSMYNMQTVNQELVQRISNLVNQQNEGFENILSQAMDSLRNYNDHLINSINAYVVGLNNNVVSMLESLQITINQQTATTQAANERVLQVLQHCAIYNDQIALFEKILKDINNCQIALNNYLKIMADSVNLENVNTMAVILYQLEEIRKDVNNLKNPPRKTLFIRLFGG